MVLVFRLTRMPRDCGSFGGAPPSSKMLSVLAPCGRGWWWDQNVVPRPRWELDPPAPRGRSLSWPPARGEAGGGSLGLPDPISVREGGARGGAPKGEPG